MTSQTDPKILARVSALLAKAHATTFGPEADAFLAKADELMASYGIDRAAVGATATDASQIVRIEVHVTGSRYVVAGHGLIQGIAKLYGCEALRMHRGTEKVASLEVLYGRRDALDAVLALWQLLDLQLNRAAQAIPAANLRNSAARGFVVAVLDRIREVRSATNAEVGNSLVPALLDDGRRAVRARAEEFGQVRTVSSRASSADGYGLGKQAGRNADLGQRRFDGGRRALTA